MRRSGPDYLAYALIDTVIDGYYPVIELIGDRLHELEETILDRPTRGGLNRIHRMRRELLGLRRSVWPQREAVNALIREETPLLSDTVRQYLRDCHDHAVQIADVIETYRELAASLMDIYLSSTGQRTNEVMKVLTVMASIFIPLTFIAGIYGMNFKYQPELDYHWAYPIILGVMVTVGAGMLVFFRRKGWIGGDQPEPEDSGEEW
jgi:magnesium transporter